MPSGPDILGLSPEEWNVISALANIALTFGLLWFARRQWAVTERQAQLQAQSEQTREKERLQDSQERREAEDRGLDRDYQLAWAEHFRLEGVAERYEKEDMVQLASLGALDSGDLHARDAGNIFAALARLGIESGFLAGVAQSAAHDAAQAVALLNALVEGYRRQYPGKSPDELAAMVRHNRDQEVKRLEAQIRRLTRDLSLLYWDAVSHSPRSRIDRQMVFADDLQSPLARAAIGALVKRQQNPRSLPGPANDR